MAKTSPLALILILFTMAGCVTTAGDGPVASLPAPSFDGPRVKPAPKATYVPPVARTPEPVQQKAPDVPAGWQPSVAARPWRWIVVHHSASPAGGAVRFDRAHKAKGWDELGYHFVIGNGTDTGDGVIEVGSRWTKQKHGAHAKTADNRYNEFGIGICLVGDFDHDRPTAAQMRALAKLTAYLMKTYHVSPDRIIGHGDAKATQCPGRNMSVAAVRRMATQVLADSGETVEESVQTASGELLGDLDSSR